MTYSVSSGTLNPTIPPWFTPPARPAIWLRCQRNSAKIFVTFSPKRRREWTMKKITIFVQYLALSQKRYKIGPYLQRKTNRNSCTICGAIFNDLRLFLTHIFQRTLLFASDRTRCSWLRIHTAIMCLYFLFTKIFMQHSAISSKSSWVVEKWSIS